MDETDIDEINEDILEIRAELMVLRGIVSKMDKRIKKLENIVL